MLDHGPDAETGRAGLRLRRAHPAVAALTVAVACYATLAVAMIGLGLLVTHFPVHSSLGAGTERGAQAYCGGRDQAVRLVKGCPTLGELTAPPPSADALGQPEWGKPRTVEQATDGGFFGGA